MGAAERIDWSGEYRALLWSLHPCAECDDEVAPANDNAHHLALIERRNVPQPGLYFPHARAGRRPSTRQGEAQPAQAHRAEQAGGWGLILGLQYFGKRYLNPLLGRWVSADPLAIHAPGEADLNVYAYVSGSVLKNVDPLGLDEECQCSSASDPSSGQDTATSGGDGATYDMSMESNDAAQGEADEAFNSYLARPEQKSAAAASNGAGTTAYQVTAYPDVVRSQIAEATANCTDGVCTFAGFVAGTMAAAITFPGDVANSVNSLARAEEAAKDGRVGAAMAHGAQAIGNILYFTQVLRSTATVVGESRAVAAAETAKRWQGTPPYAGVDPWQAGANAQRGDVLYQLSSGAAKGPSSFFTDAETVVKSGFDSAKLNQLLQVAPHETYPLRSTLQPYLVTKPLPTARSVATANPDYGSGQGNQLFLPNVSGLKPLQPIQLTSPK